MLKLAESSGTVIYENDNKLYINKKPAQWISTCLFVTGLLGIILLINGLLQLFVFNQQSGVKSTPGIILSTLGILFIFFFWRIIVYRRKINSIPLDQLKSLCVFDLNSDSLLDAQGNILSPLTTVQLMRKMQISSSSPKLVLRWNNESLTIVKGNPFSGGISAIEKILISKGIKRK
jgi:hypothetical protein